MKLLLLVPLLLIIISPPAFAQISDATGLLYSFDVETGGYSFEIETVSNFDVYDHEYDRDKKRLTLFVNSGLENNLGEVTIPQTLLSGNFTFYLNGEPYNPNLRSNEKISFITLEFEGTGENKIDIIATETFVGEEKKEIPIADVPEPEGGGCLIATAVYGSELAPQVQFLREIRDNQLMNTASGVSFMTGFNQLYYSFSPYIADYQRENVIFNELVKIGIIPLLSSLSIMTIAESEQEVFGFGIGVILLNIGMYLIFPILTCYYVMRILRTRDTNHSNLRVIFSNNVYSIVKTGLFDIIALLVLSVSVSSAFAQSTESESPIKMILDLTKNNLEESLDSTDQIPSTAQTFYELGLTEYQNVLDALESGNLEAAEESAIVAMALFEDSASVIGEFDESLVLDQLPPGFGEGVGSASETGIDSGECLGVGGVPSGIMRQVTAANIFEIQEEITDIDDEVEELRGLIESNGLDVDLEEYDNSINLAKEVLANGDIPDAQAKLELANEIKDNLYDQLMLQ